jgi:superfamily I DNA/RNA helicase/RecB family exonuclease
MTQAHFKLHQAKSALAELQLSATQRAVAEAQIESVGLVYGSPGSGKSTAVQARVAKLVADGVSAEQIWVIAATRESANTLRDEIALGLQMATAGPMAKTISSIAFGILAELALKSRKPQPELISGSEQDRIFAEFLALPEFSNIWPQHIDKNAPSLMGFRTELRDLVSVCLEHSVSPTQLEQLAGQVGRIEWQAASQIYAAYLAKIEASFTEPNKPERFDASMLLSKAHLTLQQDSGRLDIGHILVDDAHELTPGAIQLLKTLVQKSGAKVLLFGDPDSTTLAFRAADPAGMRSLANWLAKESESKVQEFVLQPTHAVRSPKLGSVLARITRQISVAQAGRQRRGVNPPVVALQQDETSVEGMLFAQAQDEVSWIAGRLRELHLENQVSYGQMAVVLRSRSLVEAWAADLAHQSIPVQVVGSTVALRDQFGSHALLDLAKHIIENQSVSTSRAIELLTSAIGGLDSLGLRRLRRALRHDELLSEGTKNSDELLADLFNESGSARTLRGREAAMADRLIQIIASTRQLIEAAHESGTQPSIEDILWSIWSQSGLEKYWSELSRGLSDISLQANQNLDAVVSLFAAANRYAERNPGASPDIFIEQQLSLGIAEDSLSLRVSSSESVALLTPAALIGRRFEVVALPALTEGVWPNLRSRSTLLGARALESHLSNSSSAVSEELPSELPNELRMLHKSVGSASQKLLLSATQTEDSQPSQFLSLMLGEIPSVSVGARSQLTLRATTAQLRLKLAKELEAGRAPEATDAALLLAKLAGAAVPGANPECWYGLKPLSSVEPLVDLSNPEALVKISPSRLESFLKCPLHWFLDSHGGSESTFSASLGTLVHAALENSVAGKAADEGQLWQSVESAWHTLSFESEWIEQGAKRRAKQMIANLAQYLNNFERDGGVVVGRELGFSFNQGRAKVTGKIDRVELYPDGRVMLIDLKTGSKDISAKDAANHAQLGLYQLALESGALREQLSEASSNSEITNGGAKLILVGQDKLVERTQAPLDNQGSMQQVVDNLTAASSGMAGNVFIAQLANHCTNENEFGSCKVHLVQAVSYVG